MSFLTISNENICFKTQGTRLGGIVAPNKSLEQALVYILRWISIQQMWLALLKISEHAQYQLLHKTSCLYFTRAAEKNFN